MVWWDNKKRDVCDWSRVETNQVDDDWTNRDNIHGGVKGILEKGGGQIYPKHLVLLRFSCTVSRACIDLLADAIARLPTYQDPGDAEKVAQPLFRNMFVSSRSLSDKACDAPVP